MGRYRGFAYRGSAFTGTHKPLNQISEQGADSYEYSIKEGEKDENGT